MHLAHRRLPLHRRRVAFKYSTHGTENASPCRAILVPPVYVGGLGSRLRVNHRSRPPEAAFAFQLLVTRTSPSVERPLSHRRSARCPAVISMSSPALRWRSGERRYRSNRTNRRTRRPAPARNRPAQPELAVEKSLAK